MTCKLPKITQNKKMNKQSNIRIKDHKITIKIQKIIDKDLFSYKQDDYIEKLKEIFTIPSKKCNLILELLYESKYLCNCNDFKLKIQYLIDHFDKDKIKENLFDLFQSDIFINNLGCKCSIEKSSINIKEEYEKIDFNNKNESELLNEAYNDDFIKKILNEEENMKIIEDNLKEFGSNPLDSSDINRCIA